MTRGRPILGAIGALTLLSAVMLSVGLPAGGKVGPIPGNNGTVKVDGLPFDSHPNNQPHVGCVFQVDFYGYDQGDLEAIVTFAVQPPTGPFVSILTDTVFIGEDPAGGGTDLDAEETYDLTALLAPYPQHPQQGWHVKLTVNAEGSQGADVKHKVFWMTCGGPTTTVAPPTTSESTTTGQTTTTGAPTTTQVVTTTGATTTETSVSPTQVSGSTTIPVTVSGVTVTQTSGPPTTLPFTGQSIGSMGVLALALAGIGTALLVASMRPEEPTHRRSWS